MGNVIGQPVPTSEWSGDGGAQQAPRTGAPATDIASHKPPANHPHVGGDGKCPVDEHARQAFLENAKAAQRRAAVAADPANSVRFTQKQCSVSSESNEFQ